jgi:hypothetical protein
MEKKSWTTRGVITEADKLVINGIVENNLAAARIFVTEEVSEKYIGEAATRLLCNINDTLYENGAGQEPLFQQTKERTIRMNRFDPAVVWRLIPRDVFFENLAVAESARLGFEWIPLDAFDFYESLTLHVKNEHPDSFPAVGKKPGIDTLYQAVYLGSLLLFNKPGYMAVPPEQHFAQEETEGFLHGLMFKELSKTQLKKLSALREQYGALQGLTNPELHFLVDLYEELCKP